MRKVAFLLILAGLPGLPAGAQVPPVPPPPLPAPIPRPPVRPGRARLKSVALEAQVRDGAARTEVRAPFVNPSRRDVEADWILPLPPGAVVHQARLLVNGKEFKAEILDAEKARRTYQAIVARLLDPMLLEYAGWGLVRARIFPVPPGGKAEVRFSMTALLPEEGGLWEYVFPFKALCAGGARPESVAARVRILSSKALGVVYSPTPGTEVRRKGETEAVLGWERSGKKPVDLKLFYSPAEKEFGALALFHAEKEGKGVFFLALKPRRSSKEAAPVPKTVVFVVDTSGSMQGKKIEQVKKALRFFLESLHEGDAFNLVPFSTSARPLFAEPKPLTPETKKAALDLVDRLEAEGGTNIDDALAAGLKIPDDGRKPILLFLTDGLPTVGETDPAEILKHLKKIHRGRTRIFVFGVGSDVNTFLLDRIAETGRGDRHYVAEGEDIEVKVSSLLQRLSRPALSDLKLSLQGGKLSKLVPDPLPDLFFGSTLTVMGRYEGRGPARFVVQGRILGKEKTWTYPVRLPEESTRTLAWLAPLWAQRRIAQLLDQIRLYGRSKELVDQVKRLGKEYGIVTPWTSYLVAQEARRLAQGAALPPPEGAPRRNDVDGGGGRPAPATRGIALSSPQLGRRAVEDSKKLARLKNSTQDDDAEKAQSLPGLRIRRVAGKIFFLLGDTWVDREFRKEMEKDLTKIRAFSPAYFRLLQEHPEAAPWLSLKGKILVVIAGKAYRIE